MCSTNWCLLDVKKKKQSCSLHRFCLYLSIVISSCWWKTRSNRKKVYKCSLWSFKACFGLKADWKSLHADSWHAQTVEWLTDPERSLPFFFFFFYFILCIHFSILKKTEGCQESVWSFSFPELFCQLPFSFNHQPLYFGHFAGNVSSAKRFLTILFSQIQSLCGILSSKCVNED